MASFEDSFEELPESSNEPYIWALCESQFGISNPYEGLIPVELEMQTMTGWMSSSSTMYLFRRVLRIKAFKNNLGLFHLALKTAVKARMRQQEPTTDLQLEGTPSAFIAEISRCGRNLNHAYSHSHLTEPDLQAIENAWDKVIVQHNKAKGFEELRSTSNSREPRTIMSQSDLLLLKEAALRRIFGADGIRIPILEKLMSSIDGNASAK